MSMRELPIIGPKSYTKAWWNKRNKTIGASEAAAIMGMSRWSMPYDVYKKKTFTAGSEYSNASREKAFRRGHALEEFVLNEYHLLVGGSIRYPVPMLIHPKYDFMSATPDALWTDVLIKNRPISLQAILSKPYIPVDAKTAARGEGWGEEGTEEIPQEYIIQAQQQMAVTGASRCDIAVMIDGTNYDVRLYPVLRNEDIIESMISAEHEFMERVRDKNPPSPDWTHPKAYDIVRQVGGVTGEAIDMSDEASEMWKEIEELSKKKSEIESAIKTRRAKVLFEMGEAGIGSLPDGRRLVRKVIKRQAKEIAACEYVKLSCQK